MTVSPLTTTTNNNENDVHSVGPHFLIVHQLIPAVAHPLPPLGWHGGISFFFFYQKKRMGQSRGWGHISCSNAPGSGRRKRTNVPPPGSSPQSTQTRLQERTLKLFLFILL